MAQQRAQINHCPRCGRLLSAGSNFVQEFWVADETVYFCWCSSCAWRGEIKPVTRVIGIEPAEDDGLEQDAEALRHIRELEYLYDQS
jgi:hypothetical protein